VLCMKEKSSQVHKAFSFLVANRGQLFPSAIFGGFTQASHHVHSMGSLLGVHIPAAASSLDGPSFTTTVIRLASPE